jgi:hypothetical protein
MKLAIKIVYMFILSVFIILTFSSAITAFYQPPKYPEYPDCDSNYLKSTSEYWDDDYEKCREEYEGEVEKYHKKLGDYGRNFFIILVFVSLLLIIAAIFIKNISKTVASGFMLGGLFTVIFGQGLTFFNYVFNIFTSLSEIWGDGGSTNAYDPTTNNTIRFVVALLGLIILIVLGFLKFRDEDGNNNSEHKNTTYSGPNITSPPPYIR